MSATPPHARRDLLCFCHLKWEFVFQRPQHLMSRAARSMRVFFFEDPSWADIDAPRLEVWRTDQGVHVARPVLPNGIDWAAYDPAMRRLVDQLMADYGITAPVLWFYTPHALDFAGHLQGAATLYDCMDELSAFLNADPELPARERRLMARCDLVFTGGRSLFEAKQGQHPEIHCFPSGVDAGHFEPARGPRPEPADQRDIGSPRAGFFGVLDERLDAALLAETADRRPGVQFVLIGPVAKIDPATLPRRPNIHYLGAKPYGALPDYVAHWDVALMPFARNAATRFISPTKTPEYLAAGLPVVSTAIPDVVRCYGGLEAVHVAETPTAFAAAIDLALTQNQSPDAWRAEADAAIAPMSWDETWRQMATLLGEALRAERLAPVVMRRW
jgi:UDP-galactopyranose mutase